MGDDSKERAAARNFGFARPRRPLPFVPPRLAADSSVAKMLCLRSGMRIALIGVTDPAIMHLHGGATLQASSMVPLEPVDVIVYQVESPFALRRVSELSKLVKSRGALWVLWPSNGRHITANHIERVCTAAGMTGTWEASVTGRLSGMKFIHRFADGR